MDRAGQTWFECSISHPKPEENEGGVVKRGWNSISVHFKLPKENERELFTRPEVFDQGLWLGPRSLWLETNQNKRIAFRGENVKRASELNLISLTIK
jgi:hypothetical protein